VKRLFCSLVVVCVGIGTYAGGGDAPNVKEESKKLEGTWKPMTAELAGKPFPDEIVKSMTLVLTDGKYTVTVGKQTDEGTWKLDLAKKPRALDVMGTAGPNKGKTFLAIYELADKTLRVCYDLSGKARPKEFKTSPDTLLFMVEYRREKP
jgi:uncharacterized protein (TIGR03067 family)